MRTKYWIKGTSTKKYYSDFEKMVKHFNLKIGQKITVLIDIKQETFQILHNGLVVFQKNKKSTFIQYLHVWKGMGVICLLEFSKGEYIISFIPRNYKDLIQLMKATTLLELNDKKADEFRFSVLIDVLYYAGVLNWYEIKEKGIQTTKDTFSEESIKNSISNYEKELAKDIDFLKRAKEKFNEITK